MNKQSIQVLSEQRVKLDVVLNSMKQLPKSREVSLAFTSLQKGRMYIGEILFQLGKEYPYDKTKEATKPDEIEKAVDVSNKVIALDENEIVALNMLRDIIADATDSFLKEVFDVGKSSFGVIGEKNVFILSCNISEAYRGLKETRMWLGVRLGEIRNNG